ncbi:MAG: NAD(P)/FAD-dependent oxidoreductase [Thermoplasmataceae archaeon]
MDCDVMIAGGGTSGSFVAGLLAEKGFRVMVAEKKMDAGSPPSGSALISSRGVENHIQKWVKLALAMHENIEIKGDYGNFMIKLAGDQRIVQFSRDKLDKHILAQAGNSGAEILIRTEVQDFASGENEVRVKLKKEGKEIEATSKCLIIASGSSWKGNIVHGETCVESTVSAKLKRGYYEQERENKLSLQIGKNSFSVASENYRAWENLEIDIDNIMEKPFQAEQSNIFPSSIIQYNIKRHSCTPIFKGNVIAIGDAAGLGGMHTGFGLELALKSAEIASNMIAESIEIDKAGYSDKIEALKVRTKIISDKEKILSGNSSDLEEIVASLRDNITHHRD